jgi:hypothetical protein
MQIVLALALLTNAPGITLKIPHPNSPYDLQRLASCYNIKIEFGNPAFPIRCAYGLIEGQRADAGQIVKYAKIFCDEFSLYPPDLIRRCRLRRIVLCKRLSFDGDHWNAVPDLEHDTLYLDVSSIEFNEQYSRVVIHHDFFHMVDRRSGLMALNNDRWSLLNPADFRYGSGGRNAQSNARSGVLTRCYPGFLNHYSTTSAEEDKAEIFANLIVKADYVTDWLGSDIVLQAKVSRIKASMKAFCPEMDESFFTRAQKMERSSRLRPFIQLMQRGGQSDGK